MRTAILSTALLASSIAWIGCSSTDDGGAGGSGATGGTGGSTTALSFDAGNALPAMGGTAVAIAFTTGFGNTVSSMLEAIAFTSEARAGGLVPKASFDFSGFCASGSATLDAPGWPPTTWVLPAEIILNLAECEGSVLAPGPVSGRITWSVESVTVDSPSSGPTLDGAADVDLLISTGPDTRVELTGPFKLLVRVSFGFESNGRLNVRLGAQRDDDLITVSELGQAAAPVLQLGCFDVDLFLSGLEPDQVAPLGVLNRAGEVYTMNDYAQMPPLIVLDEEGVPSSGELKLFSGDRSDAGEERSEPCFEDSDGDSSTVTATFFEGGCIDVLTVDTAGNESRNSTSWDKLLTGDFSEGSDGACGSSMPCGDVPAGAFVIEDSEFLDTHWEAEDVATPGAVYSWPIVREDSGGIGNTPYRNMTHSIENATNCEVSCTLGVVHTITQVERNGETVAATYDPAEQGAIDYIDYSEAQRILSPSSAGGEVGWSFALIQNGRRYNAFPGPPAFANLNWATNGLCELRAADFGPPGNNPDFSAGGAKISFAYVRSNSNTSEINTATSVHGIDDFKVVIVGD